MSKINIISQFEHTQSVHFEREARYFKKWVTKITGKNRNGFLTRRGFYAPKNCKD